MRCPNCGGNIDGWNCLVCGYRMSTPEFPSIPQTGSGSRSRRLVWAALGMTAFVVISIAMLAARPSYGDACVDTPGVQTSADECSFPSDSMGISVEVRGSCTYGFRWSANDLNVCYTMDDFYSLGGSFSPNRIHITAFQSGSFEVEGEGDCVDGIPVGIPICSSTVVADTYSCDVQVKVMTYLYSTSGGITGVNDVEAFPGC